MKFKNRPNVAHKVGDHIVWESRSTAVNGVVIVFLPGEPVPFVLVSKRGPNAADFKGHLNVVAGYLDWDESGTEALYRETWEETGLDLEALVYPEKSANALFSEVISNDLENPWHVKTKPTENRQNISLRYGVALKFKKDRLPDLTTKYNEVPGEVQAAWWMPVNQIDGFMWAFEHDKVIKEYLARIDNLDKVFRRDK
jgi:8-oxo-dGTP pyrophosphatase MutT (NUDIX family)